MLNIRKWNCKCLSDSEHIEAGPIEMSDEQKKPRSILKTGGQKSAPKDFQFDEQNVLETFHPEGKDYGHMKIDEAKTPYHDPSNPVQSAALSETDLISRLEQAAPPREMQDYDSDENLSPKDQKKKKDFKSKRSQHYNMAAAMKKARKLMEEDD